MKGTAARLHCSSTTAIYTRRACVKWHRTTLPPHQTCMTAASPLAGMAVCGILTAKYLTYHTHSREKLWQHALVHFVADQVCPYQVYGHTPGIATSHGLASVLLHASPHRAPGCLGAVPCACRSLSPAHAVACLSFEHGSSLYATQPPNTAWSWSGLSA